MEIKAIIVGTCTSKCPQSEINMRQREGLLHPFEIEEKDRKQKRPRCVIAKMVKEYKRPAAGQDEADPGTLRPVPVLHETINYLYTCIVGKTNTAWSNIYDYVFDRLRAVRQDMVIQNIQGVDAISLSEKIVRFYIFMVYRMGTKITPTFDPTINNQHTQECLKRLLSLYNEVEGSHANQIEFECMYLMFNLGEAAALTHYLELQDNIRNNGVLKSAYHASINYLLRNYVKSLRQIRKLPCLLSLCAAQRHLSKIQQNGLFIMSVGYTSKNSKYPTCKLEDLLLFNSQDEAEDVCIQCGLTVKDGVVLFQKSHFKQDDKISWKPWQLLENLINRTNIPKLLLGSKTSSSSLDLPNISGLKVNPS